MYFRNKVYEFEKNYARVFEILRKSFLEHFKLSGKLFKNFSNWPEIYSRILQTVRKWILELIL